VGWIVPFFILKQYQVKHAGQYIQRVIARNEAIPDWQSGYASSPPSSSPCTVWDCFVPRNDAINIILR